MRSVDIRRRFTDFFVERNHRLVPSSPLIPNDPTLLLANAGMNQFKPYFLGEVEPDYRRATSVQKCTRTSDIENVGDRSHCTFFEMLGNFSFGDYFKEGAIAYAWELVTEGFGLEPERLWATVYLDDDEAFGLWREIGVPAERIQRLGKEDNFWDMGVPGPCGPCSEIHYDRGPSFGPDGGPASESDRYLEIWNLVFMQNIRGEGEGKDYPIIGELPEKNIDTGMGLERIAMVLQDADSMYETDLLQPIIHETQELSGARYGKDDRVDRSLRIVTEHGRSASFLIADGVLPSNEGRGYILRRLLRRSVRHLRVLGVEDAALPGVCARVVDNLGEAWPELVAQRSLIGQVVASEEDSFSRTLRQGSTLLDTAIRRTRDEGGTTLPGDTAFQLHDTYGFPYELTLEAAEEAGLEVDADRFGVLMEDQRRRAMLLLPAERCGKEAEPAPPKQHLKHEERCGSGLDMIQQRPKMRHDRRMPIGIIPFERLLILPDAVVHRHAGEAHRQRRAKQQKSGDDPGRRGARTLILCLRLKFPIRHHGLACRRGTCPTGSFLGRVAVAAAAYASA